MGDRGFTHVLRAAQGGERWAVEELWVEFHPRLLRFLQTLAPGSAEDLASETWLHIARALGRFHGGEQEFRAWVFTVARHRWVDWRRSVLRRPSEPVPPEELTGLAASDNPEAEVEATMGLEAAILLVRTLPSDQAEVILLRVVAGLEIGQVASVVHKRPGTVRVLQHRGLRRLAQRFGADSSLRLEKL